MDFDSDLVQIQGALLKANNNHLFKYLSSRGGNEKEINSIVDLLHSQLSNKNYIDEKGINKTFDEVLRRIHLFLVFNTDLKVLDDLANSDDVGHLIWATPILTKCLLIHVVWGLNLDEYYCETIQYSNPGLSVDLLQIAAQNMKYSDPEACLKRVNKLVYSAYRMTCRLMRNISQKNILDTVFDNICELTKYFGDSPIKSKMNDWSADRLYLYAGNALRNIFDMLINCFTVFLHRSSAIDGYDLYAFTYDESNSDSSPEKIDNMDDIVEEYLIKYNELLIEITKTNVMAVNVDIYCSWSESDSVNDPDKTLQQEIGESAYKLRDLMMSDKRFNCDLISMLEPISCKPIELSDIIRDADRETVVKKADESSANQREWLTALSKRDYLLTDEESIVCMTKHVDLIPIDDCMELFKTCIDRLSDKSKLEFSSQIKTLALNCLNAIDIDNKLTLLKNTFSDKLLDDILESDDFDADITEFYNKLIEFNDAVIPNLIYIFVQNPYKFYVKAFESLSKNCKASAILDAVEYCVKLAKCESLILNAFKEIRMDTLNTDFEVQSFVQLTKEICVRNIIDRDVFLIQHLLQTLAKDVNSNDVPYTLIYLKCLHEIYTNKCFTIPITPAIVMLGQVLGTLRWSLNTYSIKTTDIIESTIKLLGLILDDFVKDFIPTDNEWRWAVNKLAPSLTPINAIHFRRLYDESGIELLDASSIDSQLKRHVAYLLPISCLTETRHIFTSICAKQDVDKCYALFCETIKLIIIKAKELNSVNAYACLAHCCRNLAVLMDPVVDFDHRTILTETVSLLNVIPKSIYKEVFNCFIHLVSRILNSSTNNATDLTLESANKIIDTLNMDSSKSVLNRVLEIQADK